jgi:2-oxoglutarate dehydrogenase E2 component (dihydrolipoamide succinyltransferase)
MKIEMIMPQMGESVAEATILKWHKGVGDEVKLDESILEISTDKVDSEIPAPASGVIVELKAQEGETVAVKTVIAIIESDKSAVGEIKKEAPKSAPVQTEAPKVAEVPKAVSKPVAPETVKSVKSATPEYKPQENYKKSSVSNKDERKEFNFDGVSASSESSYTSSEKFFSPLVRNIAEQHGISDGELSSIRGSGTQGRVTKEDVLKYAENRRPTSASAKKQMMSEETPVVQMNYNEDGTFTEEMSRMRKLIAEHMVRSKATSPHVYSVAEVDVTNIALWRKKVVNQFTEREGFKLSFTPFFLEAAVKALVRFPQVNASVEGDKLIYKRDVNLGCAVALGTSGLIVPVIKNASSLNVSGLARALDDLATRARTKKLTPDDTQGGTFTITNPGTFGNIIGYPIINQPQLAILSIGAIKKRPVVVNDMIGIRDIVYLTLSYDHRVVDGALGGQFLQYIAKYLENWDMEQSL